MKFLVRLLFFILIFNPVFGQIDVVDNIKVEKLISDFPKNIRNQTDFNLALTQIKKNESFLENHNIKDAQLQKLIIPAKNCVIWSEKNATSNEQLTCKLFYLIINTKLFNVKEILEAGNELLVYKENLSKEQVANVLNCLTIGFKKSEAFNEIIKITPLRKKYLVTTIKKINDIENDLALAYYNTKNFKSAIKSFLRVKEYLRTENDYLFVASMSNNTGLCYLKSYDYANARKYFDLAIQELNLTNGIEHKGMSNGYNDFFKAVIVSNIAKIDVEEGKFIKAVKAYNSLINKTKKLNGPEKYNIPESYLNISKIYLRLNNPNLAQVYLDSTKKTLLKIVSTDNKIEINNLEAKINLLNQNPEKATLFFNKSKKLTDSIAQVQIGRENILAQAKYNSDEKDQELLEAKIDLKSKEKISKFQKIGLAITFFLLVIIGLLYYKSLKDRLVINKQKDYLSNSLSEKDTLLKELHHRVKNNLQVIVGLMQLQSRKIKSPEMTELLIDSQQHINSMALVHEMLYQQNEFELVPMNKYLTELSKQISQNFLDKKIEIAIQCIDVELPINKAIPLGLMVSEMMTNSNKYAFENKTGNIAIDLISKSANNFEFNYADSGKGLPDNFEEIKSKTMGLRLLQMLSEEMNGNLSIKNNNGFNANLIFNRNEKV